MIHVMLDLETLSTRKNAAIVQLAAVAFNPETGETLSEFSGYVRDIPPYAHVDPGTVAWWLTQDAAAQLGKGMSECGVLLAQALSDFVAWYGALPGVSGSASPVEAIWSHGATFDLPVLCSALDACCIKQPWSYKAERDTRTLYALAPGGMPAVAGVAGVKHDALYDCHVQVKQVVGALAALREAAEALTYVRADRAAVERQRALEQYQPY
jgi:exodeoxyribonuclease VIII